MHTTVIVIALFEGAFLGLWLLYKFGVTNKSNWDDFDSADAEFVSFHLSPLGPTSTKSGRYNLIMFVYAMP